MPRAKQTKGVCSYCQSETSKGTAFKHIATCPGRQAAVEAAEAKPGTVEPIYYLRVQDAYVKNFWMDLEVRGSAKLKDLDKYLRAIWLECCGHLSQFTAGGFGGRVAGMTRPVGDVFADGSEWVHLYDYGDTSETLVRAVGAREGKPTTKHPVALLVRNAPPELPCMECQNPARWFCRECQIEENKPGTLCDAHRAKHPHEDYGGPVPLVNSPRLGTCGYVGPADPPY